MWQAVVGSAVIGGLMQNKAAKTQAAAMNAQAAAQVEAARIAAEEARFRPVGITTRFGSATPEFTDGRLTGYGYQGSDELVGLQDQLSRIYGSSLGQAERSSLLQPQLEAAGQGLFGLGSQFIPTGTTPELTTSEQEYLQSVRGLGRGLTADLSTAPSADVLEQQARLRGFAGQLSPTSELTTAEQQYLSRVGGAGENILGGMSTQASSDAARQQQRLEGLAGQVTPTSYDPNAAISSYYEEQQALMEPARMREEQRLASGLFGRGRSGLSVGAEGQPELFALAQARREQDAGLAAEARLRGRQELQQDIGLGTQLGGQAFNAGQSGRQEQLGLTSAGFGYLQQQPTAEEAARQRMLQNMGLSAQFGGQGVETGQAGQQFKLAQALQGIGLMGQATTPEEAARQRMLQNIGTGAGLYSQGAGLFGTGYGLQQAALEPFQSQFQTAQNLENVARQPMDIGSALGQQITTGNTMAGNMMLQGQNAASNLQAQAAQARAAAGAGMGQGIAQAGQNYANREMMLDIYNPGRNNPAPIENRPLTHLSTMPVTYNQGSTNATSWKNYP